MKIKMTPQGREAVKVLTLSGILIVLFVQITTHIGSIGQQISTMMSVLAPFVLGFCLAFLLIPLEDIVENKWFGSIEKIKPKTKRLIAVFVSVAIMLIVIGGFFSIMIPQIYSSFKMLSDSMSGYMKTVEQLATKISEDYPEIQVYLNNFIKNSEDSIRSLIKNISGFAPQILYGSFKFLKWVLNFFISLIVMIYILLDKEQFKIQFEKLLYAFVPKKYADKTLEITHITSAMFNQFIFGKAIDSLVVGIICFVSCLVLNFPYAPLIALVVGLTNMIPVFGPFLGAIPCFLLLLIISPMKAAMFLVFILILQQIDGNILGPYIIGDSMGLPSLWVMFAIIVGGGMFGILGMFIGVPIFSVIYYLVRLKVNDTLKMKNISFK